VTFFKEALAEDPDFFPVSDRGLESGPVMDAKKRVDENRSKLNELLTDHTENSVEVLRQRELLAQVEDMYRGALADFLRGFEVELASAQQKEATIKSQIAEVRRSLEGAPDIYRRASLIDTELSAKRALLEDLQVKSGEVRLNEMADERVSRIVRLTEAEVKMVVTGGRMVAYFAIISIFGFLFSIIVAIAVDRQDRKIYSAQVIEEYLEVPVLGVVSEARSKKSS
jgi:uncharacterized protein involved in exopolysaccharide biosynthesis